MAPPVIAFKVLRADGRSPFADFAWPLPGDGPGAWVQARVEPCRSGIHACRRDDLPLWLGRALYEVELAGDVVEQPAKLVASRARLLRRIDGWDDAMRDDYTRMCADRAHELALGAAPPLDAWDAVIEPSTAEGPALLGFVAARIAEQRGGRSAYREERRRQAAWLAERLSI
jgi:hypothetical protein